MKLNLNDDERDALDQILSTYDHLCDCADWPNCKDFVLFQKLQKRVHTLPRRSFAHRFKADPRKKQIKKLREESRQEGFKQGLDAGYQSAKELLNLGGSIP